MGPAYRIKGLLEPEPAESVELYLPHEQRSTCQPFKRKEGKARVSARR